MKTICLYTKILFLSFNPPSLNQTPNHSFLFPQTAMEMKSRFDWALLGQVELIGLETRTFSKPTAESIIVIYCDLKVGPKFPIFILAHAAFGLSASFRNHRDRSVRCTAWFIERKCSFNFLISARNKSDLFLPLHSSHNQFERRTLGWGKGLKFVLWIWYFSKLNLQCHNCDFLLLCCNFISLIILFIRFRLQILQHSFELFTYWAYKYKYTWKITC